jgi:hypothetical protein
MIRGPAKNCEAARARAATQNQTELLAENDTCLAHAQIISLPGLRPCVSCGVFVGNVNLGGYTGRGALTGELFCLNCADRSVQERARR